MSTDIVTTVLAAASTYNLASLATVRDELHRGNSNTADDAWLTRAIGQVSRACMNETNRIFVPELVQDAVNIRRTRNQVPGGVWEVQLSRFPVLAISSVTQTSAELNVTTTLVENVDYRVDYEKGRLLRIDASTGLTFAWEALPVTAIYVAGYGVMQRESHAVPASAPYTVTVSPPSGTAFSCDKSVAYANGTLLQRVTSGPAAGQYAVADGVYTFAAADTTKVLTFNYATSDIPEDLVECCLRLVTARYKARDRDPALIQRETPGVGVERWWFGSAPGQRGAFTPDIAAMLANYHVPVMA